MLVLKYPCGHFVIGSLCMQRLAARDLDNWEQRRIPRPPGERDGGF
jgi:hypothetical protein